MSRGIAASVTDPFFGVAGTRAAQFGHVRPRHRVITPVFAVPYFGYYGYPYDYSAHEEQQQPAPQPQVIVIKEESSRSEDDSRYGEHYFEDRESRRESAPPQIAQATSAPAAREEPMTTLVYRDGHKSEVRNYAIVGSNLIDLTKSPVMKKIPLDSLDLEATREENEENGVDFYLP